VPPYAEPAPAQNYQVEEPPLENAAGSRGDGGSPVPDFSVRLDPLNWLLNGKLGVELELELLEWLTVESVPLFVTNAHPVFLDDAFGRESAGLGALAGASVGVGFWLGGDSFNDTVLRVGFSSYSYEYSSTYELSPGIDDTDSLTHAEQRLSFMLGSHRTWGFFTIAGAFGLEYETNQESRCFPEGSQPAVTSGCDDLLLRTSPPGAGATFANVNSFLYPYDLVYRLSLGVAID
jgi:hypothetical protein